MDQELVVTTLRDILVQIRVSALARSTDSNQNSILGLIEIPSSDSEIIKGSTPAVLAAYYYGQIQDLRAFCTNTRESFLRDFVLDITSRVENWNERGIITDMPPNMREQPKQQSVVIAPDKTSGNELRAWRVEGFKDLNFTIKEAERLADAVTVDYVTDVKTGLEKAYSSPLHRSRVQKMLASGCNHKQIVNLLT